MIRQTICTAVLALSVATAVPAFAKDNMAPASGEPAVRTGEIAAANSSQRYCIVDQVTGSLLKRKVCKTRSDWLAQGFDPLAPRK